MNKAYLFPDELRGQGKTETMNKTALILGFVAVVLGFTVAAGPHYIFPVCQYFGMLMQTMNGMYMPMKCYWTAMAEVGLGTLIIVTGLVLIVSKEAETRRALGFVLGALGIIVALVPTYLIGVCASPDHPCRIATQPALVLLGVVIVIVAIIAIATGRGTSKE